jgi:CheY-like chemotaxis protein/anti-sigma regulatory factor (Ser/Thr protein kinase)
MLRLNRDKVQLGEFLDQIVDMFRLQAAAKGIEFRFHRPPHLPAYVHTDEKRLRQILINLLSNAIKYTEKGYASLTVRYRSQVAEFEVADTGIGIAPEDLERVFEPFERGRSSNVRAVPGTGLGLTITKLLTQIMGGEIQARSVVNEGTVFTVRVLLSEASAAPDTAQRRARDYEGRRRTVLLIDDDDAHLDIVQGLLRGLSFEVLAARDGPAGIALARERRPDLAMIDISMPGMNGWDVARELRADASLQGLKIVMVSANAHEYSRGGSHDPHDAFVMKPVDMQLLLDRIGELLGLQWIYDPIVPVSVAEPVGLLPQHARHHLDDLYRLGRIGHVRGIQAKLQEIEVEDAANKPFTAHMRSLVANFDLKRYMSVLEAMRKDA